MRVIEAKGYYCEKNLFVEYIYVMDKQTNTKFFTLIIYIMSFLKKKHDIIF